MGTKPRLFAFWRYTFGTHTGFEGVLGSEVKDIGDDGYITAVGYGGTGRFKPVCILPVRAGRILLAQVESLRREYDAAMKATNKEYEARFKKLFEER